MINENTVRVAELAVQLAITIANGVKHIIGLFRKKRQPDATKDTAGPESE